VGDKTERSYQRGDLLRKRFALSEAWAKFASTPPTKESAQVLPLRKGAPA